MKEYMKPTLDAVRIECDRMFLASPGERKVGQSDERLESDADFD